MRNPSTLLCAALLASSAAAQKTLFTLDGDSTADALGNCVDLIGDANGDGFVDAIAGAWRDDNTGTDSGSVKLVSGFDGSLLHIVNGNAAGDHMGWGSSGAGDRNNDGFADVAAAADEGDIPGSNAAGYVKLVSGLDGSLLAQAEGQLAGDFFGWATAAVGDVNGDGFDDLFAGALNGDSPSAADCGFARVLSGSSGAALFTVYGDASGDQCGSSVGTAGDVDGDGFPDVIVGLPGADPSAGPGAGRARIYSGASGALLHAFEGDSANDQLGAAVDGAGDYDHDGRAELLVGVPGDDNTGSNSGSARIYSGASGALLLTFNGDSPADQFGDSVRALGDVDADAYPDWAIGAPGDDNNGSGSGSLRVISSRSLLALTTLSGDSANDSLGTAVGGGGDLDGDGFADAIAGATGDDNHGANSGSARAYSLVPLGASAFGTGTPGCAGAQPLMANRAPSIGAAGFALQAKGLSPGLPALLAISTGANAAGADPFGLGILLHVAIAPTPFAMAGFADALGVWVKPAPIPVDPQLVGAKLYLQDVGAWVPTCAGLPTSGLSSSSGLALEFQP